MWISNNTRLFTHQWSSFYPPMTVFLPTLVSVFLPTKMILKANKYARYRNRNARARVFNFYYYINVQHRGGLCHPPHPLQEELESSPTSDWILFFDAVTTKPIEPQGFFLNGLPPASRAPPIYRTAQARQALDLQLVLQRICSYASWRDLTAKAVSFHQLTNCER